jgi:RNA polymerase sigma-70 factor, ECF subfamily
MRPVTHAWSADAGLAAAGDAEPLDVTRLFRAHGETVGRWIARLAGPSADVDDLVQEVFLVAHRRLGEFRNQARVTTWLYEIAIRVVQARRRKARVGAWRLRRLPAEREPPVDVPTPLEELERRRRTAAVYGILDKLPEAERTALILFELEGLPGPRIAELTGASLSNVGVRLHRARARFTRLFLAWEEKQQ